MKRQTALQNLWSHKLKNNRAAKNGLLVGAALLAGGVIWAGFSLFTIHADTATTASFQAENGTKSGNASTVADATASGGNAVQFGTPVVTPPTGLTAPTAPYPASQVGALAGNHPNYTGSATLTNANITSLPSENYTITHPLTGQTATIPVRVIRGQTITQGMRFQLTSGTVLFDDCVISLSGGGYHAMYIEYGPNDAWITDDIMKPRVIFNRCSWDSPAKQWVNGVLGHSYWVTNSTTQNFQNGFDVGGMSVFYKNNIYGGTIQADAHTDGIQFYGGQNVSIVQNWIDIKGAVGETGAINFSTDFGDVWASSIIANTLKGGTYTLYLDHTNAGSLHDITVKDNRWVDNSWMYGPVVNDNVLNLTWQGNKTLTSGATINP